MSTIGADTTPRFREIPRFSDDLEAVVADLECYLLTTLTPEQFSAVEILVEATRLLAEANVVLGSGSATDPGIPTPAAWPRLESRAG